MLIINISTVDQKDLQTKEIKLLGVEDIEKQKVYLLMQFHALFMNMVDNQKRRYISYENYDKELKDNITCLYKQVNCLLNSTTQELQKSAIAYDKDVSKLDEQNIAQKLDVIKLLCDKYPLPSSITIILDQLIKRNNYLRNQQYLTDYVYNNISDSDIPSILETLKCNIKLLQDESILLNGDISALVFIYTQYLQKLDKLELLEHYKYEYQLKTHNMMQQLEALDSLCTIKLFNQDDEVSKLINRHNKLLCQNNLIYKLLNKLDSQILVQKIKQELKILQLLCKNKLLNQNNKVSELVDQREKLFYKNSLTNKLLDKLDSQMSVKQIEKEFSELLDKQEKLQEQIGTKFKKLLDGQLEKREQQIKQLLETQEQQPLNYKQKQIQIQKNQTQTNIRQIKLVMRQVEEQEERQTFLQNNIEQIYKNIPTPLPQEIKQELSELSDKQEKLQQQIKTEFKKLLDEQLLEEQQTFLQDNIALIYKNISYTPLQQKIKQEFSKLLDKHTSYTKMQQQIERLKQQQEEQQL